MFSVIIPLYNKALYIEKCILSVLTQTFSNYELIIVDDGSTDQSAFIVNQFLDTRITLLSQVNAGVSVARNNGVKAAKYEYIAFLDADDWWDEYFLEEISTLITTFNKADLYGTNYFYVKNGEYRVESKGLPKDFKSGYIDYIAIYSSHFCVPINCSFVTVRRSAFFRVGGFQPSLRFGEDFDLWLRLALNGKVAYLNKPLSYSNQDVETSNRAIQGNNLYPVSSHFIFNLNYLKSFEQQFTALKVLLDGLRVRALLPYYIANSYQTEVRLILSSIDFTKQPFFYRLIYQVPYRLVRLYILTQRVGSIVKQIILGAMRCLK